MIHYFVLHAPASGLCAKRWWQYTNISDAARQAAHLFESETLRDPIYWPRIALAVDLASPSTLAADSWVVAQLPGRPPDANLLARFAETSQFVDFCRDHAPSPGDSLVVFASDCFVPGWFVGSGFGTPWPFRG